MNIIQTLLIGNWKTTVVGILGGAMLVITQLIAQLDSDPETIFIMARFIEGLTLMGLGGLAKDGNKSSRELGID